MRRFASPRFIAKKMSAIVLGSAGVAQSSTAVTSFRGFTTNKTFSAAAAAAAAAVDPVMAQPQQQCNTNATTPRTELGIDLASLLSNEATIADVRTLVEHQWNADQIFDAVPLELMPRKQDFEHLPWIKVDCMHTKKISGNPAGCGQGLDIFAPFTEEKSYMHVHPRGDRIATVLEGAGTFFTLKNGALVTKELVPGDVVYFPRNMPHAFWGSASEELLIHVVLNPFVDFDDAEHTVASPEGAEALRKAGYITE